MKKIVKNTKQITTDDNDLVAFRYELKAKRWNVFSYEEPTLLKYGFVAFKGKEERSCSVELYPNSIISIFDLSNPVEFYEKYASRRDKEIYPCHLPEDEILGFTYYDKRKKTIISYRIRQDILQQKYGEDLITELNKLWYLELDI